ncbi:MAG: hypothetical protein NW205_10100 [Hyphomicrobiaceae bacterium]|nr:hypothetical protein [Hyphomicrobiaceae bacterium]
MKKSILGLAAGLIAATLVTLPDSAKARDADDWVRLGIEDRTTIVRFDMAPYAGRFAAIRIGTATEPTQITGVRVVYGNGKTVDANLRETITRDRPSRSIEFIRDRGNVVRQVEVEITSGRRTGVGLLYVEGQPEGVPGFEVLATGRARPNDRELVLNVGGGEGRVNKVMLRAWENPVFIAKAEFIYGNGDRETFRVRDRLDPGQLSDVIDIDEEASRQRAKRLDGRFIRSVVLTLRQPRDSEPARVDLLGNETGERGGPRRDRDRDRR